MKIFTISLFLIITTSFAIQSRIVPLSYIKTEFFIDVGLGFAVMEASISEKGVLESCKISALNRIINFTEIDIKKFSEVQINSFRIVKSTDFFTGNQVYSIVLGDSMRKNGAILLYLDGSYEIKIFEAKPGQDNPSKVNREKKVDSNKKITNIDSLLHYMKIHGKDF
jgi:hypothetical protein